MPNLLKSLIKVSEKAANIARACRQEKELFALLVEEKKGSEANEGRFEQDFKTLADVLVQETVRHDIVKEFPSLSGNIRGEESNTFSNTLDKSITVEVKCDQNETRALLETVLNGYTCAAEILTNEVYKEIDYDSINSNKLEIPDDIIFDMDNIAIWIDPIDSTSEYINGYVSPKGTDEIHTKGLQCVTVLIGVFEKSSGLPIAGVVNQPFHHFENDRWHGKCYWGAKTINKEITSEESKPGLTNKIVISSVEKEDIQAKLIEHGFELIRVAGAGYKILTVICGLTDAYLLTQDTIFNWDTCAPQAILQTLRGNIMQYEPAALYKIENVLIYNSNFDAPSNDVALFKHSLGIVAYRNKDILAKIFKVLS